MDHVRIDEGQKRGPRIKPHQLESKARNKFHGPNGRFASHPPELKQAVIQDAIQSLEAGETTEQIGYRHGIPGITVRSWLIGMPAADQARVMFCSDNLSRTIEEIRLAQDPLTLARAREEFRAWAWISERRLPHLFGPKQEVELSVSERLSDTLQAIAERRAQLEHTVDTDSTQVIDSNDV